MCARCLGEKMTLIGFLNCRVGREGFVCKTYLYKCISTITCLFNRGHLNCSCCPAPVLGLGVQPSLTVRQLLPWKGRKTSWNNEKAMRPIANTLGWEGEMREIVRTEETKTWHLGTENESIGNPCCLIRGCQKLGLTSEKVHLGFFLLCVGWER